MALFGRAPVHFKSNAIVLVHEADRSAALSKMWNITYRENAQALGFREDDRKMTLFGRTDEQDVASRGFLDLHHSLDGDLLALDALADHCGIENSSEGIMSENTDLECSRARRTIARPRHELSEVVKVGRFDLGLTGSRVLSETESTEKKQHTQTKGAIPRRSGLSGSQS